MKKILIALTGLFLTFSMQGQVIPQPKPGPSPKINIGKPQTFELPNGLKVLVVENHKLPRFSATLTIDNAPYAEGDKKGVADLASALIGNGTKKISKEKFNEEVDFLGANIGFWASGASASSLSKYSGRVMELMADGALNPVFTQEEFDKEKAKLIESLKADEKSVPAAAERVGSVLTFGRNHPNGEYLSEQTINNVTLADVQNNYNTYFVPENAYLVIVGDVKFKDTKKMVEKLFGGWKKASAPNVSYSDPKDVQYTQINFVDMPNAVQSEIGAYNVTTLKMGDKDYFAAIVANQIFGGDFNSYINMNLREAHGWTYGARSGINGDKWVSRFSATTQVRNAVTDSAVVEMLKELKRIRTENVTDEMLNNVKAGYIGRFVMNIEKPQTVAQYALRIKTQELPENFYENYIANINAVTAEDVKRVANTYFKADNWRIVVVGKGADVLPGLEKIGLPILYFDKYGNPAEKPVLKRPAPAGVTAKTVTDSYIKAIGGEKAVKGVKTIFSAGSATIPQAPAPLAYVEKRDVKGRMMVELSMPGMGSLMKQVVGDKEGYQAGQGQKQAMDAAEFAKQKASAVPFEELALGSKAGVTVSGIEQVNGKDAYALVDGEKTYYYDVASGLKVAESQMQEGPDGKKAPMMFYIGDYRDVKGVKIAHNLIMNVGFELDIKMSDVKINEGVTDADFQ